MSNPAYKPVNWLHLTAIECDANIPLEMSISENSGRVKMSFGRFDDGKFGFTHESLKAFLNNDVAIERARTFLDQVEGEVTVIRADRKELKELEKQQAKLNKNLAKAAETMVALSDEQIQAIAAARGLKVTKQA